jgi:hypothetical protein
MNRRWLLIGLAGAAAGVLVIADRSGSQIVQPSPREKTGPAQTTAGQFSMLPQRRDFDERGDLFAKRSWAPPAPPKPQKPKAAPVAPAEPPPPAPPPNPYRFAGTALQGGVLKTFLAAGDRLFEVRVGEVLEPGFRVESVTPEAVVLVYEALGTRYQVGASPAPAPAQPGGHAGVGTTAGAAR